VVGSRRRSILAATVAATLLACAAALTAGAVRAATRAASALSGCPGANVRPSTVDVRALQRATLCLVNRARAAHGLVALHANRELEHVAFGRAASMVSEDYFADVGPSGRTLKSLVAAARYTPLGVVGENIAWGTEDRATPARIVAAWLASAAHREVMLDGRFRAAGVAATTVVPGVVHPRGADGATYVIELGARASATSACPGAGGRVRLRLPPPTPGRRRTRCPARASTSGRG